jgi:hypothetical protein
VNIYFCRVPAENNQRWPTCQVYIERKDHTPKKYNLEGLGSKTLGGGTHPSCGISFHLADLASTAFEDE